MYYDKAGESSSIQKQINTLSSVLFVWLVSFYCNSFNLFAIILDKVGL